MTRNLRTKDSVVKFTSVDKLFAAAMIVSLFFVFVVNDRNPPQDAAVVVPFPSGSTCLADDPEQSAVIYDPYPKAGDRVGTVTLESLGLSWPILEGTEEAQLSQGVGHYIGSVLPGVQDNSILSGHRSTVFARLGELKIGDRILVETSAGTFVYQITQFEVVDRSDQSIIQPSADAKLTLTTCYPFGNIVSTSQAYIVTADLISSELKNTD